MKAANRKSVKAIKSKTVFADELLLLKQDKWVIALQLKQVVIPLVSTPDLSEAITQAERLSASLHLQVNHTLNRPVTLTFTTYRVTLGGYAFTRRTSQEFGSVYSAYLYLRAFGVVKNGDSYVKDTHEARVVVSSSHGCTVLSDLLSGEPLKVTVCKTRCPRCLTRFVTTQEAGGLTHCLDCGHAY